ncbi:glycosyltransferase [Alphaproteobacteria bacterium]|nr:glycosyltransferase [Alphaproteobacteria bacterium]
MLIFHIITGLDGGGAEKTLLKLCKESNSLNIKHCVISLQINGVLLEEFKKNNIKVYNFNFKKNLLDIYQLIKIISLIKKCRPSFIMTWLYHADFIGLIIKFFYNKSFKLIWNVRCSEIKFNYYSIISKYIFKFLIRFSHIPDAISFNSFNGKNFHFSKGYKNKNIHVISNFLDTNYWKHNERDRKEIRHKLNISSSTFLVGNIGRYDPQKDHNTFINSAIKLIEDKTDIKFLIIGKDTNQINIKKEIRDYFIILDYKNNIKKYYSALDLLVLSSSYGEGFSNVILESMSMSVPCIASNVGDNKRIVSNDDYIFDKGDVSDLSKKIYNLSILNHNFKNNLKKINRTNIKINYDTSVVLNKYYELWK